MKNSTQFIQKQRTRKQSPDCQYTKKKLVKKTKGKTWTIEGIKTWM